jgi:hypothetical protein
MCGLFGVMMIKLENHYLADWILGFGNLLVLIFYQLRIECKKRLKFE